MRRGVVPGVVTAVAISVLAACSGGHHTATISRAAQPTATLVGTLGVYGGVEAANNSCGCFMEPGTVKLSDGQTTSFVVSVGRSGQFSTHVPAGRYTVEAGTRGETHWPMGSCGLLLIADKPGARPTPHRYLTIMPSQTTHVVIGCVGL
jgi:hypothetical protein